MIDLAPESKRGLELGGPLILAGGYGGELGREVLSRAHALVTPPTSLRPIAQSRGETRLLPFPGGFLFNRGGANPGLAAVMRANRLIWRRLGIAVILSLAKEDRNHWPEIARRVSRFEGVAGLELEIDEDSDLISSVDAVRHETDLPILAKVPILMALDGAHEGFQFGADALTVGFAPRGMGVPSQRNWVGRLAGPAVKPLTLRAVRLLSEIRPELPLIAAGGVESATDVRELLDAGARAVVVESALWRDPEIINEFGSLTA